MRIGRLHERYILLAGSLFVGLLLPVERAHAQPQQLIFDHYTVDDGLANATIGAILQDRQGFMWFGTVQFVSKFDGYSFTNYRQVPGDTTSYSGGYVSDLLEDRNGNIWIGSASGLNRINPQTGS